MDPLEERLGDWLNHVGLHGSPTFVPTFFLLELIFIAAVIFALLLAWS
jgi:hypothetical protein